MRTLIAGFGNVLHGDDGFGVAVARRLQERSDLPPGVTVLETGIAGLAVVQELMHGYDVLVAVDAMQRGGMPGTVYVLEAEVPDARALDTAQLRALTADMHLMHPSRVLVHARALGVLPGRVWLLGCEPQGMEEFTLELSDVVAGAVEGAVGECLALIGTPPAELNA